MFQDYKKYLSTSLKVYLFVLIIIFIMKLVGLDYFGIDLDNPIINIINNFCLKFRLDILYSYAICFITTYIMFSLSINDNSKQAKRFMILVFPITILVKYSGYILNNFIFFVFQCCYLIILGFIYKKQVKKEIVLNNLKVILFLSIFQIISMFTRNQKISVIGYSFVISLLMDIDYIIMIIMYYKIHFMKGGRICYQTEEVGYSLQKKINLKKSLKKLQKNLLNFRKLEKQEKLEISIYFILSLIWNILTLVVTLVVAKLNHTFVECIFILTSFWLSKRAFGKAFHLSSMIQCFIVSNLTYYVLNRITTPLGISIAIPIMLGVGLSYFTSKLVKKIYKPLYRGMPEDIFNETILKVVDKDSEKYKICYDYYIKKERALALSFKYKYSEAGIRKIKDRVNEKIKELE